MYQIDTKANSDTVTSAGFMSGSAIWKKMRASPAPSMRAASSSESGTDWAKKVHIRYRPKGLRNEGMITAHGVFVMPMAENMRNWGITSATPGTAIEPRITSMIARLPPNSSLERA